MIKKYFEKRKLVKYLNYLENNKGKFPAGYLTAHNSRIEWLKWLIASYEGKASEPKTLLESLIKLNLNYDDYVYEMQKFKISPLSEVDRLKDQIKHIEFLYQWVYYKKITGF